MGDIRLTQEEARAGVASSDADIHVENEIVQAQYSLDPATRLLSMMARWVAVQVAADTDPNESAAKFLYDIEGAADVLAMALNLVDVGAADDTLLTQIQKALTDTDGAGDSLLTNIRALVDDMAASADQLVFAPTLNDRQTAVDALNIAVRTVLADAEQATDAVLANIQTPMTDNGQAVDSGAGYNQTYAANYVEPEYVGEKFNF